MRPPEWHATGRVRRPARGFTLIELLLSLAITAMLVVVVAPLAGDWSRSAQTAGARARLVQGWSTAKALALRNPEAVPHTDAANTRLPAAGLQVLRAGDEHVVLVCTGDPADDECRTGGSRVVWRATFTAQVGTVLAGTAVDGSTAAHIGIDNRGVPLGDTGYALTSGGSANDEAGTLH